MERETAVAWKRVEDAETALKQEQKDMRSAESRGLTSREPRLMFEEMMDPIGDSLSELPSSGNEEDGEDDKDMEQGKLSKDDEQGWVMGTISKTVLQCMERLQLKMMKLDELTHPGWQDAADCFLERNKKYGKTELNVPEVIKPHPDDNPANPVPKTFGELMESLDIIPGISQMLQRTS